MAEVEGVIKFRCQHEPVSLSGVDVAVLAAWRDILVRLGLLGQDPARYDGYGFGNVSRRTEEGFLVSGTQTGHLASPGLEAYAEVTAWQLEENRVVSRGDVKPSSESLTHAAIYSLNPEIRWVFHVHSPDIWTRAPLLSMPVTDEGIAYGTLEMARAVAALFDPRATEGVFAMGGHEDGVIAFASEADRAGALVVDALASALAVAAVESPSH